MFLSFSLFACINVSISTFVTSTDSIDALVSGEESSRKQIHGP